MAVDLPPSMPLKTLVVLQDRWPDDGADVLFDGEAIDNLNPQQQLAAMAQYLLLAALRLHRASVIVGNGGLVSDGFLNRLNLSVEDVWTGAAEVSGHA